MKHIMDVIDYILSFEVYVLLPILMFSICMIVKMPFLMR